jgi:O-antigen/teichoic acid export membrane protein
MGSNLFRLVLFAVLIVGGLLSPISAFLIFSVASLSGFFISWLWLNTKVITTPASKEIAHEFWKFNKWTGAFMVLSSVVSRLDVILTSRYATLSQIGAYSLALTMVSFLPQLSTAIGAVTSSKFAGLKNPVEANNYLKKATILSTIVGFTAALLMIPVAMLVIWFTGKDFSQALIPFLILLASLVIFMMGNPLRDYILYFTHNSRVFFWTNLWQGVVLFVSCSIIIPRLNIIGSAISVLISHVFLALYCLHYYIKISRTHK